MKKFIAFCLVLLSIHSFAQYKFSDPNSSSVYRAKIFVAHNTDSLCSGKATILVFDKITGTEIQRLTSEDLIFTLKPNQNPKLDWVELGKYQSPLVFGDFDFDGNEDIAIRNGSNSAFKKPSYDVYLYKKAKDIFEKNSILTTIASGNLGMFTVDKKAKEITVNQIEGCCIHKSINYTFDTHKGLTEVSSMIEDTHAKDEVVVIKQKLINGKMQQKVEKFKASDYFKAN
ncbi:XAC2610-related protein [Pedobacter sp. MW01-1-1]|uniref:XAC2610-related protein n=1 Tax=Pedobacter sp. MW01-1-1 TaxID=3383027 RepID=UPI003FEFC72B